VDSTCIVLLGIYGNVQFFGRISGGKKFGGKFGYRRLLDKVDADMFIVRKLLFKRSKFHFNKFQRVVGSVQGGPVNAEFMLSACVIAFQVHAVEVALGTRAAAVPPGTSA